MNIGYVMKMKLRKYRNLRKRNYQRRRKYRRKTLVMAAAMAKSRHQHPGEKTVAMWRK